MKGLAACVVLLVITACKSAPPPAPEPPAPAFTFAFSNFTPGDSDAEPPIRASVYVKIVRIDGESGQVEWSKIHSEGDRLGWDKRSSPPTSVHDVFSRKKGKTVTVDFDSAGAIISIAANKPVLITFKRCPVTTWPARCPGPEEVKAPARVSEVKYTDSQGKPQVFQKSLDPGPPEDLCVPHGGTRETRTFTSEKDAAALLAYADDHWHSRNPKIKRNAQVTYQKLLKDHRGDKPVPQNLDRIKSRAETAIED